MRETEFRTMQAINARRSGLLFDQFMFLETRQRSFESVMGCLTIWDRIKLLIWPGDFKRVVDRVHMNILNDEKSKRDESVKKAKEEANKPKLAIVGANGVALNGR
jgi:hypothetical protein